MASLPGILRRRLLTNLPPSFHPFALQTAAWIHNRLPRPGCLIFYHGCLFHWFSKMQKSVSLSSAEAEYFGAMMAARDLIFVRDLLIELAHTRHWAEGVEVLCTSKSVSWCLFHQGRSGAALGCKTDEIVNFFYGI